MPVENSAGSRLAPSPCFTGHRSPPVTSHPTSHRSSIISYPQNPHHPFDLVSPEACPWAERSVSITMPCPRLSAELLDYIVKNLRRTERSDFKNCCLVSKSWVPRARKYLFFHVAFRKGEDLESWKDTFPDPSTSPAHYTQHLSIGCPQTVTATDTEEGGLISTFCHVIRLDVHLDKHEIPSAMVNTIPLPGLEFLHHPPVGVFPASCVFSLMALFPHLEELIATNFAPNGDNRSDQWPTQKLPLSMRSISLSSVEGIKPIVSQILPSPGSLHLHSLEVALHCKEDFRLTTALVEECSALQFLSLKSKLAGKFI